LLGKRVQIGRASLDDAKAVALDACHRIASGQQHVLELRSSDRMAYLRATEALAHLNVPIDSACRDYAEAVKILAGVGSLTEAARFFVQQRSGVVQKPVSEAVNELVAQIETEQRNTSNGTRRKDAWLKLLKTHLQNKLAKNFCCNVADLSSATLGPWFVALKCSERSRSNIRDCVAFFLKWCKGKAYLNNSADPLANVQKFRKRKRGAIKIISAEELGKLLANTPENFVPYLALRAFAGLRDSEARAMDWQFVDFEGGWIDIPDHIAKQADDDEGVARMVKIRPVLAEWLRAHHKKSGRLCPYVNAAKRLSKVAAAAGVSIPRNALRHSFISAAVTQSNDLNAVAIEAGNSPAIIRQHYWRKMRPDDANKWFAVEPAPTLKAA